MAELSLQTFQHDYCYLSLTVKGMIKYTLGLAFTFSLLTESVNAQSEFEAFCAQYDQLETVAGLGKIREKGENGWQAKFEGGSATKAELSRPHYAMADEAGNIYIADKDANAIRVVRTDGTIETLAGTGKPGDDESGPAKEARLRWPNGIFVKPDGVVYILDLGNDKVKRVNLDGTISTVFSDKDGIAIGRGLWVSDDEQRIVYCSLSRVKEWTPKGGVKELASGFRMLGNLDMDHNGDLIVTDRAGGKVYRLDEKGNKIHIAGSGKDDTGGSGEPALETTLEGVRAVWCLDDGAYLLGTHEGGDVWFVGTDGIIHKMVRGDKDHTHKGDGKHFLDKGKKISEVRSISIAPNGDILICENDYGYIRVIKRRP